MMFSTRDDATATAPPGDDDAVAPILRLLSHVRVYKALILAAALVGLLVTGLVLCFVPPSYDAEAVVVIGSRHNKLADAELALSSLVEDQYHSALNSELAFIRSPEIARKVIASLGLVHTPDFAPALTHVPVVARFQALHAYIMRTVDQVCARLNLGEPPLGAPPATATLTAASKRDRDEAAMTEAVKIFERHFEVRNDPKSLTIYLRYRASSPALAAAIANAVLRQVHKGRRGRKNLCGRSLGSLAARAHHCDTCQP